MPHPISAVLFGNRKSESIPTNPGHLSDGSRTVTHAQTQHWGLAAESKESCQQAKHKEENQAAVLDMIPVIQRSHFRQSTSSWVSSTGTRSNCNYVKAFLHFSCSFLCFQSFISSWQAARDRGSCFQKHTVLRLCLLPKPSHRCCYSYPTLRIFPPLEVLRFASKGDLFHAAFSFFPNFLIRWNWADLSYWDMGPKT